MFFEVSVGFSRPFTYSTLGCSFVPVIFFISNLAASTECNFTWSPYTVSGPKATWSIHTKFLIYSKCSINDSIECSLFFSVIVV